MDSYICNGNKYRYSKGYIGLPIEINASLPKEIGVESNTLTIKSSFHISLVCVKNILNQNSREGLEKKIIESFCKFTTENDISFIRFTDEFRFAISEGRKTIVAMCEVSNLNKFFRLLSEELGVEVPTQPTHVTLYTLQPDLGIGLNSQEELEDKSKVVKVDINL